MRRRAGNERFPGFTSYALKYQLLPQPIAPDNSVGRVRKHMIETTERLAGYLESCKPAKGRAVCAIDTEADSLHRYKESLCLVQFATRQESVLIDPLAIEDLSPLMEFMRGAEIWMHGRRLRHDDVQA